MFISKELATAMAEGRKRFLSVYEGRAVLVMPFAEQVRHVATHWVPELSRSLVCSGEGSCRYHHLQDVAKMHVAAWVARRALAYSTRLADVKKIPAVCQWDPSLWSMKIVELTEACFESFERGAPYGTIGLLGREPGRKNNKAHWEWLETHRLEGFPAEVQRPEEVVPAVIRGTYYPTAKTSLDTDAEGRTKHKIYDRRENSLNTEESLQSDSSNHIAGPFRGIDHSAIAKDGAA